MDGLLGGGGGGGGGAKGVLPLPPPKLLGWPPPPPLPTPVGNSMIIASVVAMTKNCKILHEQ